MGKVGNAIGDVVGGITGANRAADAAQAAANAQADAARGTRADVLRESARMESLAQATPQELSALSRSYASAEQDLAREERLMSAIDPALMEASKQALNLLRGQTADINKPMTDMRNSQRQNLLSSLRSQYGPGAESTSIGQRALQQFDMETNALFAQNQNNALNQAFGIATTDAGARSRAANAGLQQVGQGYGALQGRRLNAAGNTLNALAGTSQQMIQAAGAPYVGEALRGQAQQSFFNNGMKAAAMAYGMGAFGGGAAPAGSAVKDAGGFGAITSETLSMPEIGSSWRG